MAARGADPGFLRRLEPILSVIAARGPVRLAFSGGMASLVLAALLRKRAELECVVAGVAGSHDLDLAAQERLYLDFRVTEVRLSPAKILSLARALARRFPAMPVGEVLDAVPLQAVRARFPEGAILAGHGASPVHASMTEALSSFGFELPLLGWPRPFAPTRPRLVAVARSLGLPEAFVGSPPRSPSSGSGVGPALRALSTERQRPLARLVRP